jgi:hypothetical protein
MKKQIFLISALLALTVTVSAGWGFDDKQGGTSGKLQKAGNNICFAVEVALNKTGGAFKKAGDKTTQALAIAAGKTSQTLEKTRKRIQLWFDDKNASKEKQSMTSSVTANR